MCNFKNQEKVKEILSKYDFDYLIVSIHFIKGWGFDFSALKHKFTDGDLVQIWKDYAKEIEDVANTGMYDILGHPFNLRLFKNIPEKKDVDKLLESTAKCLKKNNMIVDVNTGTFYRYPIKEITPYRDFMEYVKKYDIPVILSSDSHYSEHVGMKIREAGEYVKEFGITEMVTFDKRKRKMVEIG